VTSDLGDTLPTLGPYGLGFDSSPEEPMKLMVTLLDIRDLMGKELGVPPVWGVSIL
jgi:hypothetical protein